MRYAYLAVLAVFLVLTWAVSLPSLRPALTILTIGAYYLVVVLLASVSFYLLAALPGLALRLAGAPRPTALAVAGLCVLVAAILPGMIARLAAGSSETALVKADLLGAWPAERPRTLEMVRPANFPARLEGFGMTEQGCDGACEQLLVSGQLDWVRVVRSGDWDGVELWRLSTSPDECPPVAEGESPPAACAVPGTDDGSAADMRIVVEAEEIEGPRGWRRFFSLAEAGTVRASIAIGEAAPFLVRTQRHVEVQDMPTLLATHRFTDFSGYELIFIRTRKVLNPFTLADIFASAGFSYAAEQAGT